jgi:cysteine-rich repeat protein
VKEGDEQCDDGNKISGDGCSSDCKLESIPTDLCGNGDVESGEECDDDNDSDGDGCSSDCEVENGWECSGEPSDCEKKSTNAPTTPAYECGKWPDLSSGHAEYGLTNDLCERGDMTGSTDGNFYPERVLNRAELLKVAIFNKDGKEPSESYADDCFDDIDGDEWYAKYVCYAAEEGIVSGYSDGTFRPGQDVSMAEALKMFLNANGIADDEGISYNDPNCWYCEAMEFAEDEGLLPYSGDLETIANVKLKRIKAANMDWRILDSIGEI